MELIFGMPGPELFEAAEEGDVVLGLLYHAGAVRDLDLMRATCNWTGFERYGQLFEENDLAGVMNAHAQYGSELFFKDPASIFVDYEAE